MSKSRFWTKEEEIFLRENYENMFDKDIANKLHRPESQVQDKRRRLRLKRTEGIEKVCPICGKKFRSFRRRGTYCSPKCRITHYRNEWHIEEIGMNHPRTVEVERYVAKVVLPKHGFRNILWTRPYCAAFPMDIFATKDGEIYGIEVTERPQKSFHKKIRGLIDYFRHHFGLKIIICHIRPDNREGYILNELYPDKWYSSSLKWHSSNRTREYLPSFRRVHPPDENWDKHLLSSS